MPELRELRFSCCICDNELSRDDPEASEIVVIAKWFSPEEEWIDQYWWVHRKPCLEAAMHPRYREFVDLEEEGNGNTV